MRFCFVVFFKQTRLWKKLIVIWLAGRVCASFQSCYWQSLFVQNWLLLRFIFFSAGIIVINIINIRYQFVLPRDVCFTVLANTYSSMSDDLNTNPVI